jgi:hypothetical protein
LIQVGHVSQAGQSGQSGQTGHVSSVDQSIKVFNRKIISQLSSIHNIFSTQVKSIASFRFNLSVYNFILVHVFISNNILFASLVQSVVIMILFIV